MTVCGTVTGAKPLSSKKLLSEPAVYCPPNNQCVFIEKARLVGCPPVRVMPPTSASSGSAATPAPPITLACSTVRREMRRLSAASRFSGLPSALNPGGPLAGVDVSPTPPGPGLSGCACGQASAGPGSAGPASAGPTSASAGPTSASAGPASLGWAGSASAGPGSTGRGTSPGSAEAAAAAALSGLTSAAAAWGMTPAMAMSARSSGGVGRNPGSSLAGRNHRPDSRRRGSASALGVPPGSGLVRGGLGVRPGNALPGVGLVDAWLGLVDASLSLGRARPAVCPGSAWRRECIGRT